MGFLKIFILLAVSTGSSVLFYKLLLEPHPIPKVEDEYWGLESKHIGKEDISIHPFQINISTKIIQDLKTRLKWELDSNRLIQPLTGIGFEYGINSKFLKTIGQNWLNKYDWTAREKLLNKYPHFKTKIGGLNIHFQHIKSKSKNGLAPRPLLILHGWPGSFVEFQKIIPLLSEPNNSKHNYELVIPSLPGYGFSDGATRPGMSPTEMGSIFRRLMERLGHKRFYVMGGDWGAIITSDMATVFPESVIAAQSNMCVSQTVITGLRYVLAKYLPGSLLISENENEAVLSVPELVSNMVLESGYFHIHATKPDTVGVALTHSPLGLAAYIMEKFSTWTNRSWKNRADGGLLEKYTADELLDNIMIYWVTGSMTTSVRLYAEMLDPSKHHKLDRVPTNIPFSCQYLPGEILVLPRFALESKYTNIKKYEVADRGGHFGAFEEPDLVASNAITHFENN